MPLSNYLANKMFEYGYNYLGIHTGTPPGDQLGNRHTLSMSTPGSRTQGSEVAVLIEDIPEDTVITHISIWDSAVAGNMKYYLAITPYTVGEDESFPIPLHDLAVTTS